MSTNTAENLEDKAFMDALQEVAEGGDGVVPKNNGNASQSASSSSGMGDEVWGPLTGASLYSPKDDGEADKVVVAHPETAGIMADAVAMVPRACQAYLHVGCPPECECRAAQQQRRGARRVKQEEKEADQGTGLVPNAGNGYTYDNGHTWVQTLQDVTYTVPLPRGTKAKDCMVSITKTHLKVSLKGSDTFIIDEDLHKEVMTEDSFWNISKSFVIVMINRRRGGKDKEEFFSFAFSSHSFITRSYVCEL